MLITIAILGILAATVIPQFSASAPDQVLGAAQILVADLDYARALAIANGTRYELKFQPAQNRYILTHSGTNANFDRLPENPFRKPSADRKQLVVAIDDFPQFGTSVKIASVHTAETSSKLVGTLEFDSLGQTTREQPTLIWLSSTAGAETIFLPVEVNPVTGLASVGEFTRQAPILSPNLEATGS